MRRPRLAEIDAPVSWTNRLGPAQGAVSHHASVEVAHHNVVGSASAVLAFDGNLETEEVERHFYLVSTVVVSINSPFDRIAVRATEP